MAWLGSLVFAIRHRRVDRNFADNLRWILVLIAWEGRRAVAASELHVDVVNNLLAKPIARISAGQRTIMRTARLRTRAGLHAVDCVMEHFGMTLAHASMSAWELLVARQIAASFGREPNEVIRVSHHDGGVFVPRAA